MFITPTLSKALRYLVSPPATSPPLISLWAVYQYNLIVDNYSDNLLNWTELDVALQGSTYSVLNYRGLSQIKRVTDHKKSSIIWAKTLRVDQLVTTMYGQY